MPSLNDHARAELNRIGLPDSDPMMAASLLAAVDAFAGYGHSGSSAEWARETLNRLLAFKPLTSITNDPAEWEFHHIPGTEPVWQNRRDSRALSADGGRTYCLVDEVDQKGEWPVYVTPSPEDAAMLAADVDAVIDDAVLTRVCTALLTDPDDAEPAT